MIINLTPHALTLRNSAGIDTTIGPSGTVARVTVPMAVDETVTRADVLALLGGAS